MPLKVELRTGEQVMINGAVITNVGNRAKLAIHNRAEILPGRYVMKEEAAVTSLRSAYFFAQMTMMSIGSQLEYEKYRTKFEEALTLLMLSTANVALHEALKEANTLLSKGLYFKALKSLKPLIDQETRIASETGVVLPPVFASGVSNMDGADEIAFGAPES